MSESKNRRIAKNTLLLYIRMMIMMFVSLFTSRILLQKLGVEDYGIYNIVGGIIVMFSFIQAPISSATQRFINYELGKGESSSVQKVFSVSLYLYFLFSLLVILVGETLGLYFLNSMMNIPSGRLFAANIVYQMTIVTFTLNLIRTPYYSSVIAYERMDFFAYWSICMAVLKLVIVYLIVISPWDALITYAVLFALITILETGVLIYFCKSQFDTTCFKVSNDRKILEQMATFSGWSLFGGLANTASQYGLNILVNIFYGVSVNAAIGIANQVSSNLYQLISNFQTAFNPQIVKSYAEKEYEEFLLLIERTSKFSYYLFLIVSVPFIIFIHPILELWLGNPPEMSGNFCRLILVFNLILAASNPIWMSVQATGNIKKYQLIVSSLLILNFPLSYFCLRCGCSAYSIWIVRILIEVVVYVARLYYLKGAIHIDANRYLLHLAPVMIFLLCLNLLVSYCLYRLYDNSILSLFLLMAISASLTGISSFLMGFSRQERVKVLRFIFKLK